MEHALTERIGFEVSCHSLQIAPWADHRADGKGQFDMTLWLNYSITNIAYGVGMYCRISSNNFISYKFGGLLRFLLLDLQYVRSRQLNCCHLRITKSTFPSKHKGCKSTLIFKESHNLNSVSNTRSFPKCWYFKWFTVFSINSVTSPSCPMIA